MGRSRRITLVEHKFHEGDLVRCILDNADMGMGFVMQCEWFDDFNKTGPIYRVYELKTQHNATYFESELQLISSL